jgi:heme/copper-type cytochrome/quinol oxidase subunit 4
VAGRGRNTGPSWERGNVKTSSTIAIASLVCAVALTVAAERRSSTSWVSAWAALIALYFVCVGVVSTSLVYFLSLREAQSLAASVPLAVPAFLAAIKMSER